MNYDVYGPFTCPYIDKDKAKIASKEKSGFWEAVNAEGRIKSQPLSQARGIYIFSTFLHEKYTPWYVGKARGERGFFQELFTLHKLNIYRQVVARGDRKFHSLARVTAGGDRYCTKLESKEKEIKFIETMLIGMAWRTNDQLANRQDTARLRNLVIPGLHGKLPVGRPFRSAQTLREVFKV